MRWHATPYAIPSLFAAAAALLVAGLTWRRSRAPGLRPFRALCLCAAAWCLFQALGVLSVEPAPVLLRRLQQTAMVATPVAWLAFAAAHARRGVWRRGRAAALWLSPPVVALVLVWTGRAQGPAWFAVSTAFGALLAFAGAALALWSATPASPRRSRGVWLACLLVLSGSVLSWTAAGRDQGLEPASLGFALAAVALGVSLFRPRLLDLAPVARSLVVEGLADGVIVLDGEDRIADCNAAAEALLAQPVATLLGSPAAQVLPAPFAACLDEGAATQAEITLDGRSHEASIAPLGRSSVAPAGRVILLRDVTARRRAEQELILARTELQHAHAELQHLADTDALTGLRSRRFFLERLSEEVARTRRHGQPLSLLMIDLDRFKHVNDRWGHVTGDQILATVAALVRSVKRETDLAGRLGGEEFAMMLPATDAAGARLLAERLLARLRAEPYDAEDGTRFAVTASLGLATLDKDMPSGDALLASASRALHRAKEEGRDRVAS